MELNQIISQINGCFADAKTLYWLIFIILTLMGLGLLSAGTRYFKRILFFVGAVPTYICIHWLAGKFGLPDAYSFIGALIAGVAMILCSWMFIYTWGFWTAVGIFLGIIMPCVDLKSLSAMNIAALYWMTAVLGVAGGCFALIKCRDILVIVTSLTGAAFFVFGVNVLVGSIYPQFFTEMTPTVFVVSLMVEYVIASASGVFVQYKFTLPKKVLETDDGKTVEVVKKSKFVYRILALSLGSIGVHSLYARQYRKGVIQLLIAGSAGFLYFVPLFFTSGWALISFFRASKNLEQKK
jgi:TM2 domain-containing membrane protein YozV